MLELTELQRQDVRNGTAITLSDSSLGNVVIMTLAHYHGILKMLEAAEDRKEQAAFLQASHQSAIAAMKENPY